MTYLCVLENPSSRNILLMNKIEKMNKQHLESETTIPSRYDVLEEIRHDYDETYTKPYLKRKESR